MCSIIREASFEEELAILADTFVRMSDLDSAIDWALERAPTTIPNIVQVGTDSTGNEFYVWVTDELFANAFPVVRIFYKYHVHTDTVYLISIMEIHANQEVIVE